jgi:hypothetical protein
LQNFIDTGCLPFKPLDPILELDESYYNTRGWGTGATSCKGEICWSWNKGKGFFDWQLFSSNLPVRISNVEKISKSISETVKKSQNLRRDASSIVSLALEFLQTSFGGSKGQDISKERIITGTKNPRKRY